MIKFTNCENLQYKKLEKERYTFYVPPESNHQLVTFMNQCKKDKNFEYVKLFTLLLQTVSYNALKDNLLLLKNANTTDYEFISKIIETNKKYINTHKNNTKKNNTTVECLLGIYLDQKK